MSLNDTDYGRAPPRPILSVTYRNAAKATGIALYKISKAIERGELTSRKAGKSVVIEWSELQRWLKTLPYRGRKPDTGAPEAAQAAAHITP